MAHRPFGLVARLVLALAVLLVGLIGAFLTAAGQSPAQVVEPPGSSDPPAEISTAGPKPLAASRSPLGRADRPVRLFDGAHIQAMPPLDPLAPGSVTMSYWIWIASNETTCGQDRGGVVVNGSIVADVFDLCISTNTGGWVKRTVNLSGFTGAVQVQVQAEMNATLNSNLFVDDVTLDLSGPGIVGFVNGDLESGPTGEWYEYSSVLPIPPSHLIVNGGWPGIVRPHSGNWAVWLGGVESAHGELSYIKQGIQLPAPPTAPVLHSIGNADGDGDYLVTWSIVAAATIYTLEEDDDLSFASPAIVYQGGQTSIQVSGQRPGEWYYRVRASNAGGDSSWSNTESVAVTVVWLYLPIVSHGFAAGP